jgi:beta-galactosidase
VWVFSNGHRVELFANDGAQGARLMADCPNRIAEFHVPYAPGTLVAVSRDEAGRELARHELTTAGPPARLELTADKDELWANGQDLVHVTAAIVDEHGVRVPHAEDPIGMEVQGAGRLLGMDNGELLDHQPYPAPRRQARHGRCLGVVRAGHHPGPITITAVTPSLPPAAIDVTCRAPSTCSDSARRVCSAHMPPFPTPSRSP